MKGHCERFASTPVSAQVTTTLSSAISASVRRKSLTRGALLLRLAAFAARLLLAVGCRPPVGRVRGGRVSGGRVRGGRVGGGRGRGRGRPGLRRRRDEDDAPERLGSLGQVGREPAVLVAEEPGRRGGVAGLGVLGR